MIGAFPDKIAIRYLEEIYFTKSNFVISMARKKIPNQTKAVFLRSDKKIGLPYYIAK